MVFVTSVISGHELGQCRISTASCSFLKSIMVDPVYASCLREYPESFSRTSSRATGRVRYEYLGALEVLVETCPNSVTTVWTAIYQMAYVLFCQGIFYSQRLQLSDWGSLARVALLGLGNVTEVGGAVHAAPTSAVYVANNTFASLRGN